MDKILPIRLYGDSCLKEIAFDVELEDNIKQLIADLFKTLKATTSGIGLASTQIGIPLRAFVINYNTLSTEFINPTIIKTSDDMDTYNEGCLSIPNIILNIKRPISINIEYYVLDNNNSLIKKIKSYYGLYARIIQHEFDHINGICITDKVQGITKKLLLNKLNKIVQGKSKCQYETLHIKDKDYVKIALELKNKYVPLL